MKSSISGLISFRLSVAVALFILLLCLLPLRVESQTAGGDKWAHGLMFLGLSVVLWAEVALWEVSMVRRVGFFRKLLLFVCFPFLFSAAIELLQTYATAGTRQGDFRDLVANAVGIIVAQPLGCLLYRSLRKGAC